MGGSFSRPRATRIERTGGRSGTIVPGRKTAESSACSAGSSLSFRRAPEVITRIALPGELFRPKSRVYTTPYTTIFIPRVRTCTHDHQLPARFRVSSPPSCNTSHARVHAAHAPRELFACTIPFLPPLSRLCVRVQPCKPRVPRTFFSRDAFTARSFHRSRRTALFLGCRRALSLARRE